MAFSGIFLTLGQLPVSKRPDPCHTGSSHLTVGLASACSAEQVAHRDEVLGGPVASGPALGGLERC